MLEKPFNSPSTVVRTLPLPVVPSLGSVSALQPGGSSLGVRFPPLLLSFHQDEVSDGRVHAVALPAALAALTAAETAQVHGGGIHGVGSGRRMRMPTTGGERREDGQRGEGLAATSVMTGMPPRQFAHYAALFVSLFVDFRKKPFYF